MRAAAYITVTAARTRLRTRPSTATYPTISSTRTTASKTATRQRTRFTPAGRPGIVWSESGLLKTSHGTLPPIPARRLRGINCGKSREIRSYEILSIGGDTMHRKQVRAAARTAALGGTLVLGLGIAPAAMAQPPVTVHVACYAGALASAISGAVSGETIVLAPGCVYRLDQALPDVGVDLTIVGYDTELLRDYGAPSFSLLTIDCMDDL